MREALALDWPRLARDIGRDLIAPRPACFHGPPGGLFEAYRRGAETSPAEVVPLGPAEAARRFPQLRLDGMGVLLDRTAGVIDAQGTVESLAFLCARYGVEILENTTVRGLDPSGDPIRVDTDRGTVRARRLVVTAGPWTAALLPAAAPRLTVLRQTVGYFRMEDEARFPLADYPVWAYLGGGENDFYYGFPEPARGALKAARHVTTGAGDAPGAAEPDPSAIRDLRRFLETRFTVAPGDLVDAETCLYTMTATEDFILDTLPGDPRVVVGAGFSGHGFKFGPLTGRILAELCLEGRTTVAAFERNRALFSMVRE
jgi:sarcosine oxidase